MDGDMDSAKKLRVTYLAGGAAVGGLLGFVLGNLFLGSSIGMVAGVLLATRTTEER
jgi:hypothetical protein